MSAVRWPRIMPYAMLSGLALGGFVFGYAAFRLRNRLPLLQQAYLVEYARVSIADPLFFADWTVYVKPDGHTWATNSDTGDFFTHKQKIPDKAAFKEWLCANVYDSHSLARVLLWPEIAGTIVALFCAWIGLLLDRRAEHMARFGNLIRGPRLISQWRQRQISKRGGFSIQTTEGKVWIPRELINHHLQFIGATRCGKSSTVRQLVRQFVAQGWPCVFIDLKGEYTQEFYRPGIDYIVNFSDERCCRWMIGREAEDEPHSVALAHAAFPDEKGDQPFFKRNVRSLFGFLLASKEHPTLGQLADWMANPKEIDRRIRGTQHAITLSKLSPNQRDGVLSNLALIANVLRWMPDDEGRQELCIREWAQANPRRGHIFLSSTAVSRDAQRPIQSMVLDMILLAMQTHKGPGAIIADEIGQFHKLPQFEPAMSLLAASGNPILAAFQGVTQLNHAYSEDEAESLTTNPYTHFIFRTSAGKAADHASKLLGMPAQVERVRESKPIVPWAIKGRHYSTERVMDSPVTAGEIQSARDLECWMSQAGQIVKMQVPYTPVIERQPKLIPRILPLREAPRAEFSPKDLEIINKFVAQQQKRQPRGNTGGVAPWKNSSRPKPNGNSTQLKLSADKP